MSALRTVLLAVICLAAALTARAEAVGEDELKAALIFKFAQFTDWPSHSKEFNICVLGAEIFGGMLSKLEGKTLKETPVVVKHPASGEEARNCHIVFLNPPNPTRLSQWLATLEHQPVLTVSDDLEAWERGVMIVFSLEMNRVRFDINASAAREAGLNLRAQMLKLAREVR